MNVLSESYYPVFIGSGLSDIPTVLALKNQLGVNSHIFTRNALLPLILPSFCHRIFPGWTDDFIADVLNDFAECHPGRLLYLIPCSLSATEFTERERENLENNFIVSGSIPQKGSLPLPDFLNINDFIGGQS